MRFSFAPATLFIAGALACGTAFAAGEYGVAYMGLRGSYVWTEDAGTTGNGLYDYDQTHENGYGAALFMGWVLDESFRMEIEGGYRHADLDQVTIVRADLGAANAIGDVIDAGGHADLGTAMVNLYYDVHVFDGSILPWIGAGLGGAYVDYNIVDTVNDDFNGKDNTWAFAYQFMAGVTFPVGEGVSMSVGYRYFKTEDFTYENTFGEEMETSLTQQSVDVGLQFHL
ncbi:MAG: porin family protein [Alphaproteobacteria bacterium]|nr:porin family protein [Alphaproteobacteria bacterium]